MATEVSIGKFCKTVAQFCNHLQTKGAALKESVDRRPIPLDSASTTFLHTVNRRVSTAANDLNMLESMCFGIVSFEELLGHCNEVLKKNQNDLVAIHQDLRFSSSSCFPDVNLDEEVDLKDYESDTGSDNSDAKPNLTIDDDPLLDDAISLKKFGISDVSLATIASQENNKIEVDESYFDSNLKKSEATVGESKHGLSQEDDCRCFINVSINDYESLPKHMKGLVSWEDLIVAVDKMNSYIGSKKTEPDVIHQGDIELLELGFKARSYLLLLIKMNRLRVETSAGVISYRVL